MGKDKEHDKNLEIMLDKIKELGLTLNKDKCVFGKKEVEFLGFSIDGDGIRADQMVQGILDIPVPKDKAVSNFLGYDK